MMSNSLFQASLRMLETAAKLDSPIVTVLVSWIISRLQLVLPLAESKHQNFAKLTSTEIGDTAVTVCCIRLLNCDVQTQTDHLVLFYLVACLLPETFTDIDNVRGLNHRQILVISIRENALHLQKGQHDLVSREDL